nr:MAG TPA: hypothetical protein [Caudoviricetes sp.]
MAISSAVYFAAPGTAEVPVPDAGAGSAAAGPNRYASLFCTAAMAAAMSASWFLLARRASRSSAPRASFGLCAFASDRALSIFASNAAAASFSSRSFSAASARCL